MLALEPYVERLEARRRAASTALCVGIDPRLDRIPVHLRRSKVEETLVAFGEEIAARTAAHAACWKPQIAFFEAHGLAGLSAYARIVAGIRSRGGLVVGDAKRGDLGTTSEAYARAHLEPGGDFEVDALTVNPYLGADGLQPFVDVAAQHGKGLYVLVRTSNPGSADLQEREDTAGVAFYERVADLVGRLGDPHRSAGSGLSLVGAVVGATYPAAAQRLRDRLPHTPFLVPGYGAQGAGVREIVPCFRADGSGAIVNASRSIIHPAVADAQHGEAVASAARAAAEEIHAATANA